MKSYVRYSKQYTAYNVTSQLCHMYVHVYVSAVIFGTQPTLTSVPNIYTTAGAAIAALLLALGFIIIIMAAM